MSYENKLIVEINLELSSRAERGEPWVANWIAHEICNSHKGILGEGEDREFWLHCTYQKVRDTVRRCINKRAGDRPDEAESQFRLPGYDHLQSYYIVKRDDQEEEIGVSVFELTDAEIEAKAELYRSMGRACFAHADELNRFKSRRTQGALPLVTA